MVWGIWIYSFVFVVISSEIMDFVSAFDCGNENYTVLKVCTDSFHEGRVAFIDLRNAQNSSETSCNCVIRTKGTITGFKLMAMQVWEVPEEPSCGSEVVFRTHNSDTYIRCTTIFPTKVYHMVTGFNGSLIFSRLSRPFSSDYCVKFTSGYNDTSFQCYDPSVLPTTQGKEQDQRTTNDDGNTAMVTGVALSVSLVFIGILALIVFVRLCQKRKEREASKQLVIIPTARDPGVYSTPIPGGNGGLTLTEEDPPPIYAEIPEDLLTKYENCVNERLGASCEGDETGNVVSPVVDSNRTSSGSDRYSKEPLPHPNIDIDDGYVTPVCSEDGSGSGFAEFRSIRQCTM